MVGTTFVQNWPTLSERYLIQEPDTPEPARDLIPVPMSVSTGPPVPSTHAAECVYEVSH
ncbi:hypothetical protein DPMN_026839 [Dreissena polymorpha]|uniref:Uncharacterized protein n=1 Tax=Dreissena polymorpha TaxID=45954 RepID=A0A9D4REQ0_DREPO|nr:hypothetical protein DPMN_026839 [Dreissena polymorpha]